jgi:hypothetical protein
MKYLLILIPCLCYGQIAKSITKDEAKEQVKQVNTVIAGMKFSAGKGVFIQSKDTTYKVINDLKSDSLTIAAKTTPEAIGIKPISKILITSKQVTAVKDEKIIVEEKP